MFLNGTWDFARLQCCGTQRYIAEDLGGNASVDHYKNCVGLPPYVLGRLGPQVTIEAFDATGKRCAVMMRSERFDYEIRRRDQAHSVADTVTFCHEGPDEPFVGSRRVSQRLKEDRPVAVRQDQQFVLFDCLLGRVGKSAHTEFCDFASLKAGGLTDESLSCFLQPKSEALYPN